MDTAKKILLNNALLLKTTCKSVPSIFDVNIRVLLYAICLLPLTMHAQSPVPVTSPDIVEQQLEAITENNEDAETEDDSFLQSMRQFLKDPINLNSVDITTLKELAILSPGQIRNFISYRTLFGNFISIYELQAVPGFDLPLIERLRPYITVSTPQNLVASLRERFNGGTSAILTRVTQLLEEQKGYTLKGDVDFINVAPKCSFITPVPGGVGLMTIAALMTNTYNACILKNGE